MNVGRPDPNWSVDTSLFKEGAKTAEGGIRNRSEFWQTWLGQHPETLSKSNRYRIEELGVSPKIDKQWVEYFSEHSKHMNETLIHHHVEQGRFAIPVPESTHVGFVGTWHIK